MTFPVKQKYLLVTKTILKWSSSANEWCVGIEIELKTLVASYNTLKPQISYEYFLNTYSNMGLVVFRSLHAQKYLP